MSNDAQHSTQEDQLKVIIARLTLEKERAEQAADKRRLEAIEAAEARRHAAMAQCDRDIEAANRECADARLAAQNDFSRSLAREVSAVIQSQAPTKEKLGQ